MAAYYPHKPTPKQQQDMTSFINIFANFYPCEPCAEDLQKDLKTLKPDVSSQRGLSQYFCQLHNRVNKKLDKPLFDCDAVDHRWLDGWPDGRCD